MKKKISFICVTILCCSFLSSYKASALSEKNATEEIENSVVKDSNKDKLNLEKVNTNNSTKDSSDVSKESSVEDSSTSTEETTSDSSDSASQSSSNDSNQETTATTTEDKDQQEPKDEKKSNDIDKETKGIFDQYTPTNFVLSDWEYELRKVIDDGHHDNGTPSEYKDVYVLKKYKGTNKNLEIPGLYKEHEVWLTDENNGQNIFPMDIESVKFVSQHGVVLKHLDLTQLNILKIELH